MDARVVELIEAADLNGLLRAVDNLCAARAWDELFDLADLCEEAVERGKQLWPISAHIDYRVALEGPADYAAQVLHPDVGRFAHGPLTEVAASTHPWADLAPHIEVPQLAAYVAQERVLRGEVLEGDERAHPQVLDLPLSLQPWEPAYALPIFRSDHVEVPEVSEPRAPLQRIEPQKARVLDEPELVSALLDLVQPWLTESNGAAAASVVEGDAWAAIAEVSYGPVLVGKLEPAEAVQRMAWAAASGGAHGRRRGGAFGRYAAWSTAALLCDQQWPVEPDALGADLATLSWYRWEELEPEKGWLLRLAVEDPEHGWAAAIAATDVITEDDDDSR